ncbi:peptide chain release factor N(5)-glutamine methyltransferase [Sphingosinicella sp. CPCC 101087]|uniref:peptide chain release factor N(5)-glutamine methyltransferase n=1 Tax=Sphingosinicella sp. CPCC 101087 TaxID=2497754 RepID=UPI00101B661B|nr:peptide chain release factor N(5)-glutamine methyltransferase [Sphingosinicella sp. CPCC 101087]
MSRPDAPSGGQDGKAVRAALAQATRRLAPVTDTPRLDAELLMAHALGCSRDELLLGRLDATAPADFGSLVERRLSREPVAYIVGRRAFWTIDIEVGPGVLVPRPDSETLIEAALDLFGKGSPATILDLGTGPGTLVLAALDQWPGARGVGVDRSDAALDFARRNADRLGLSRRVRFVRGDWGEGIEEKFELVLCNPPYVEADALLAPDISEWEPAEALYAGADGLGAYRRIAPQLGRLLAPRGAACIEVGAGQHDRAAALFAEQGFTVSSRADLSGVSRCLILRPGSRA